MPLVWTILWLVAGITCHQMIMACYPNIKSNGSTEPYGDITLPLGSELVINCTLNTSYKGPRNSSDIIWVIAMKSVSPRYITILDERSAQLRIQNVSAEYCGKLSCKLKPESTLCMNTVILVAPIPNKNKLNFSCTSYEWKNLKCSWRLPPNCGHTLMSNPVKWKLSYAKFDGRVNCSKIQNDNYGNYECVFDETTVPTYDVFMKTFYFELSARTAFETKKFNFEVDHFSRVIASPPENLRNSSYESTKLKLRWDIVEEFELFREPLVYQLLYRSEWDKPGHIILVNQTSAEVDNLIPYTFYSVWIRCRSRTATDEAMWSTYINGTFQTLSAVPVSQVNTTSSNFIDVSNGIENRKVTIFWKPIPKSQHFGPNFHYKIWKYVDGVKNTSSNADDHSFSYGPEELSNDKQYSFKIQAANDLGVSPNVSTIVINKSAAKIPEAEDLMLFYIKSGVYHVTWKPPKSQSSVSGYSVVWCKGGPYLAPLQPCSAPLDWTYVPANETTRTITVEDKSGNGNDRFGVAVNTDFGSSGLTTWSKCVASYNGTPDKVKMSAPKVEGPTSIRVSWELACSQQLGIITGFQIEYCSLNQQKGGYKGEIQKQIVEGAEKRSFTIQNLRPYTNYSITVRAMAGEFGQACDPQTTLTQQAAPSDPPSNLTSTSVSNSSISVRWGLPSSPNGILRYFLVHYNNSFGMAHFMNVSFEGGKQSINLVKNIECYTNYTITVQACTVACSPHSKPLTVLTDIGVPGQPEMPNARVHNSTHFLLEWDEPTKPNGPIVLWNLFIMRNSEDNPENSTQKVHSSPFSFPFQCDGYKDVEYGFAVQAITETNEQEKLLSEWSDFAALNVCSPTLIFGVHLHTFIGYIAIGVAVFFVLLGLTCYCVRSLVPKYYEISKITAVLPEGLITDGKIGYNDFEKKLNQNKFNSMDDSVSVKVLNRLQSISSDEGRGSQNSTETTLHETSSFSSISDENMYTDKTSLGHFRNKHNLSSDSSGCSTGEGSVSSTVTTRTHFPSDSGNEADLPTPVTSPDAVFYDVWPAGVTSSCQLRMRTLQRLGEEDSSLVAVNGERSDTDLMEKEDLTQLASTQYCKPANNKSEFDTATMKSNNVNCVSTGESNEIKANETPFTMYSRLALMDPPKSNSGYQASEHGNTSEAKDSVGVIGVGTNPQFNRQGKSTRPASYVALAILSDPGRAHGNAPSEELVRDPTNQLTPYSCVGLVTKPRLSTCHDEDETNEKQSTTTNNYVHNMEFLDVAGEYSGTRDATHLPSVPCFDVERRSDQMPTQQTDQISDKNQTKPKRPSYIALSRIEDPSASRMSHSGYSKVGNRDRLATRCQPKAQTTAPVDSVEDVIEKTTIAPAVGGYVTLGLMDPGSLKNPQPLTDVEPGSSGSMLRFDPTLVDEPVCNAEDGSSWESELEIEENLTEEDLHSVVQQPSSSPGYVCFGMLSNEGAKDVI